MIWKMGREAAWSTKVGKLSFVCISIPPSLPDLLETFWLQRAQSPSQKVESARINIQQAKQSLKFGLVLSEYDEPVNLGYSMIISRV